MWTGGSRPAAFLPLTGGSRLAAFLPPCPGDQAKRTLLCTSRPFRQWLQAAGGGTNNARARGSVVLPYCRDMPVRKRPAPDDAVAARQTLLDGLARDPDIFELLSELAPLHP